MFSQTDNGSVSVLFLIAKYLLRMHVPYTVFRPYREVEISGGATGGGGMGGNSISVGGVMFVI